MEKVQEAMTTINKNTEEIKNKQTEKYIRFENSSYQRIVCVVAGTWNLEQEEEKTTDF